MKLVVSAVFFLALLTLVFWRERRRWKRVNVVQEQINTELPKLVQTARRRYEQKFGRAPSVLEGVSHTVER